MRYSYVVSDNVISSLGFSTVENFQNLVKGNPGIKVAHYPHLYPVDLPASLINAGILESKADRLKITHDYPPFEQLIIISISEALRDLSIDIKSPTTLIILSSTKGNIDLLKNNPKGFDADRVHLGRSAREIGKYFCTSNTPLVVSNACISGVLALNTADRFIKNGRYENVIVAGCDVLSEFIVSGFQSFLSLSPVGCKPFDIHRTGLSLGEAAATVVLTSDKKLSKLPSIEIVTGAGSNDANHISCPSRTGEGLFIAIKDVIKGNGDVDFISAHGTATSYNDDMESIALKRNNLNTTPVNSFKGYVGHTLGAAGIIESIFCFESMKNNMLVQSLGFKNHGTIKKLKLITETKAARVNRVLKTASGFGGSNAAILFRKSNPDIL